MQHRGLPLRALLLVASLATAGCASDDSAPATSDTWQADVSDTTVTDTGNVGDTGTPTTDAGPDAAAPDIGATDIEVDVPQPPPPTGAYVDVKKLDADEVLGITGLDGWVHVSIDEYGIPHILAESVHDAMVVDGYLAARDRFPQMELIRRTTSGTLSKLAGKLDDGVIEDDIFARVMGFRRVAQQVYDSLADDALDKRVLDAYADGVNAYIERLRNKQASVPADFALLINISKLEDWDPVDSLVLARYQIFDLSFDAKTEIGLTARRAATEAVFNADSDNPDHAARAGIAWDIARQAPADPAIQYPGFPGPGGGPNPLPPSPPAGSASKWTAPDATVLADAQEFLRGFKSSFSPFRNSPKGASNSWVVSGSLAKNGNAMLANDPHLDNDSPALFYQAHIVVEPKTEADGPALNVVGAGFPGLPGILIGHNEDVAWGLTTASYDYTDAFVETLVWKDGEEYPRVLHNGDEVKLDIIEEQIEIGLAGNVSETITVKIPWVPHHGPLSPKISGKELAMPEGDTAISYAWRGFEPSPEMTFLVTLLSARGMDDVKTALESWVLGSQNLVFADREGNIFSTGQSYIPKRPDAAKTWDPETNPGGHAPWWTLPGTGEYDWMGQLDLDLVPHAMNPPEGYVVAANNDQVGVTLDNDPLNDYDYIGYDYDIGFRAGRITRLIQEKSAAAPLTLEDMEAIQGDTNSNLGERLAPFLVAAADKVIAEYDAAGTAPEVASVVASHPDARDRVAELRDLLAGWTYAAEDGVWGTPTEAQRLAATQTSLFNFWAVAALQRAFADELAAAPGMSPGDTRLAAGMLFILEHPDEAATLDTETGESILWDDLTTAGVKERRDAVLVEALFDADTQLQEAFGSQDPNTWAWGTLHGKTFESIIPNISGGTSPYDWPQPEEGFPNGYPRKGDNFCVNVCNGGLGDYKFTCGGGPIMRFVAEMAPEGVIAYNTIPGGEVWDKSSPHFRDLLDLWLNDERHPMLFYPDDVLGSVERHIVFEP